MKILDEVSEAGVTERRFELEVAGQRVPGIVWLPAGARGPRPLLLQGHGGVQHKRVPNVLELAQRMVRNQGYAVAAIDAPWHGDRVTPEIEERIRQSIASSAESGAGVTEQQRKGLALGAQQAGVEWKATLDALQQLDEIGSAGPVAYWGVSMGTRYGVPFVASEPRVKCAVFGLFGTGPDDTEFTQQAKSIKIPLLFTFQLNDELIPLAGGVALFSAFGSEVKTMHINPGSHVSTPLFERDFYEAFFVRQIGSARS
jgi:dienelactone hydrolase